ncbi:type II toxin-antitoxin system VapC family toxin [Haloferula sp. A504]|uniref:type II toxin-antitoxin system VapC family toxin n=1 Tax=Haloferula sp. A504 TaxID=3373601 RepID=UPI0031C811F9|nr:type II toxin-antitoxin system VapC family toxin [Verrucomicrobiaceae bacterium E54]
MIYLDTSAFLKLYLRESGSQEVQDFVAAQDDPLPVWDILEGELTNALRLKAFWKEITEEQAEDQIVRYRQRKQQGFYHVPEIDRRALMDAFQILSRETPRLGCRTLDILHVACANLLKPEAFITFNDRQRSLADHVGLQVPAILKP